MDQLGTSKYSSALDAEASVRLIIELIIHDRLEHLEDGGALKLMKFWPEVA
jgi:hypothetical protein